MLPLEGHTGVRTAAVNSILSRAESFVVRQSEVGYELTGPDGGGAVFCETWAQVERVLFRLHVPRHKVEEIGDLLFPGTSIVVRRSMSE